MTIDSISVSDEKENTYLIKGTGFTKDTYFCVDNKTVYNIEFIDENNAILHHFDEKIDVGDKISLRIIGEKLGNVLKESKQYEWGKIFN